MKTCLKYIPTCIGGGRGKLVTVHPLTDPRFVAGMVLGLGDSRAGHESCLKISFGREESEKCVGIACHLCGDTEESPEEGAEAKG